MPGTSNEADTTLDTTPARREFWKPRYWPVWCLYLWMRFTAALPLRASLAIHRRFGHVLYKRAKRQRRIVERNLAICFPELADAERHALAARYFESLGMSFAEMAFAWFAPDRRLAGHFEILGREHLDRALAAGKGVVLYTGHFTTLEICGRPLKHIMPRFACMFSHRSNDLLDDIQRKGRMRSAHESIPSDNVRAMIRSLKRNAAFWYAPDQIHRGGELVPFFHELAVTNVATSKLARVTGATVVPFSYRRTGNEGHYELCFHPPPDDFPTGDSVADTERLVRQLEDFVRAAPDQYQWMHRRFKDRPPPLPDLYATS